MGKYMIQNVGMIVTNKCNLSCAHCMRGKKDNVVMSDKVIDKTLNSMTFRLFIRLYTIF